MPGDRDAIIAEYGRRRSRYRWFNAAMFIGIAAGLYLAREAGVYREAFVPLSIIFLLWIFNADRLCRCPACEQSARGRQGLIHRPLQCESCGAALR